MSKCTQDYEGDGITCFKFIKYFLLDLSATQAQLHYLNIENLLTASRWSPGNPQINCLLFVNIYDKLEKSM